eukprot:2311033-Heterocapsa_arctica.AAC.1
MPPSRKQIRSFSWPLKYLSVSLGVGVLPAMIKSAMYFVSIVPSTRHTSCTLQSGSGCTCSASHLTVHFS